jgi:hypothetical protein
VYTHLFECIRLASLRCIIINIVIISLSFLPLIYIRKWTDQGCTTNFPFLCFSLSLSLSLSIYIYIYIYICIYISPSIYLFIHFFYSRLILVEIDLCHAVFVFHVCLMMVILNFCKKTKKKLTIRCANNYI